MRDCARQEGKKRRSFRDPFLEAGRFQWAVIMPARSEAEAANAELSSGVMLRNHLFILKTLSGNHFSHTSDGHYLFSVVRLVHVSAFDAKRVWRPESSVCGAFSASGGKSKPTGCEACANQSATQSVRARARIGVAAQQLSCRLWPRLWPRVGDLYLSVIAGADESKRVRRSTEDAGN